nr:MAG TPA: hypothetical protein [Bacteriophage sp.]
METHKCLNPILKSWCLRCTEVQICTIFTYGLKFPGSCIKYTYPKIHHISCALTWRGGFKQNKI